MTQFPLSPRLEARCLSRSNLLQLCKSWETFHRVTVKCQNPVSYLYTIWGFLYCCSWGKNYLHHVYWVYVRTIVSICAERSSYGLIRLKAFKVFFRSKKQEFPLFHHCFIEKKTVESDQLCPLASGTSLLLQSVVPVARRLLSGLNVSQQQFQLLEQQTEQQPFATAFKLESCHITA